MMSLVISPDRILAVVAPPTSHDLGPPPSTNPLFSVAMASCYLVIPVAVGALAGWLVRKARGDRVRSIGVLVGICCLPLLVPLVIPFKLLVVGVWDTMFLLALIAVGFIATGHSRARRTGWGEVALLAISVLIGASAVEVGYRVLGNPAPRYMPGSPMDSQLFLGSTWMAQVDGSEKSALPYPALYPGSLEARLPAQKGRPYRVLHVGDSMTVGVPLPAASTYVGLLNERDPLASHINAGLSGSGPDFQLLLVSNWIKELKVDAVVVHFAGLGDLSDIDLDHHFCGGGPLLSYADGQVTFNCREPRTEPSYASRFRYSPPPYLFRVLAESSIAAQGICSTIRRAQSQGIGRDPDRDEVEKWEHGVMIFQSFQEELAAQGVALRIVVLPSRVDLDRITKRDPPMRRLEKSVSARLAEAGVETLDPWSEFLAAVKRSPQEAWFRNDVPDDGHFDVAGHALMADWLWAHLDFEWQSGAVPSE